MAWTIRGPEPCPVRGDYHQWAFMRVEPGAITASPGGSIFAQGPDRLVFYCQFCLRIAYWDELVSADD